MKRHAVIAAAAIAASVFSLSEARAEESVTTTGPNATLLKSGVVALAVPYLASVIVASQSDRQEDKNLYIPVAGPWMDFANRGGCGGQGEPACSTETAYKVLLVGSGVLQGIGALEILGSFIFPETRTETRASTAPRFVASPYMTGTGYGMSAVGTF